MDREALELLGQEIKDEREAQLRHFESQDAKAGIVLGFSGVLVAIGGLPASLADAAVHLVAFAASALALSAFFPRSFPALDVYEVRRSYEMSDAAFLRVHLIDTRIAMLGKASVMIERRTRRLRSAVILLALAIAIVALNALIRWVGGSL